MKPRKIALPRSKITLHSNPAQTSRSNKSDQRTHHVNWGLWTISTDPRSFSDHFGSHPAFAKALAHASWVNALEPIAMAVSRASKVRAAVLRRSALILAKAGWTGLKSVAYGGGSRVAPATSMTLRARLSLWAGWLPRMTTSPWLRVCDRYLGVFL